MNRRGFFKLLGLGSVGMMLPKSKKNYKEFPTVIDNMKVYDVISPEVLNDIIHPPVHINCRCKILRITSYEV